MKSSRWIKWGAYGTGLVVLLFAAAITERALANSAAFVWTMNWREVDGSRNDRLHHLEAGALTIEGKMWVTEKVRGASPTPLEIRIEVFRQEMGRDPSVCSLLVKPSTILNERRDFLRSCGRVETGTYYLIAAKPHGKDDVDGWHNQGSGSLTTTK